MAIEKKSPSKYCKEQGAPSLKYVADCVEVPRDGLHRWSKTRRKVFKACVEWAVKEFEKGK